MVAWTHEHSPLEVTLLLYLHRLPIMQNVFLLIQQEFCYSWKIQVFISLVVRRTF